MLHRLSQQCEHSPWTAYDSIGLHLCHQSHCQRRGCLYCLRRHISQLEFIVLAIAGSLTLGSVSALSDVSDEPDRPEGTHIREARLCGWKNPLVDQSGSLLAKGAGMFRRKALAQPTELAEEPCASPVDEHGPPIGARECMSNRLRSPAGCVLGLPSPCC